jgi:hypothetical protein
VYKYILLSPLFNFCKTQPDSNISPIGTTFLPKSKLTLISRSIPVIFLLVTILSFGLLIPWLGYYWDDWAKILVSRLYGLGGYFAYYAEDRPISSWTHMLFTPLVGQAPIGWHILTLLLRWLSGWGMWWCLSQLWPQARRQNFAATVLFLVYPVFTQQAVALTFHQQWLQFALFFVSVGAMFSAWRVGRAQPRKFYTLSFVSILTLILHLSVTEYFVPLELIRPVGLWILLSSQGELEKGFIGLRKTALKTLRAWAPYLLILGMYTVWRLFFIQLPGGDPYRANTLYELLANPLATLGKYGLIVAVDEVHILINTWTELLKVNLELSSPITFLALVVGVLAGGITAVCLVFFADVEKEGNTAPTGSQKERPGLNRNRWAIQVLVLGILAVLLGPVPAWITGRQVVFDFHSNRYALPAMFGAALLSMLLVEWLAHPRVQRAALVGLLVMLAVGYHIRVANDYRWIWTDQMRVFWQLYWRAPGLKPGTAVFFEEEPFPNQGLFSTSAELNLLYPQPKAANPTRLDLDYWVYTIRPRYDHAPSSTKIGLSTQFRTLKFLGSTPSSLLVYKNAADATCVWVLSADDNGNPEVPALMQGFLGISTLDQIITDPGQSSLPPQEYFGPEPEHDWCYYFQKASLARQTQDWAEVSRLADEVLDKGYRPNTPGSDTAYEWQPFIEGLANAGRWEEAALLTRMVYEVDQKSAPVYCALWQNGLSSNQGAGDAKSYISEVKNELGCSK